MRKVKAGCTAAALLAAMFAVPAMAQSAAASGGASASGGVSTGTGGSVSTGTGGAVGSSTTASPSAASTPNANDPSAAPGLRSAATVDSTMNTTMPMATIPGGAVVQYTPRTDVMGASGTALVQTGPTTVTYSHYFVNVPADAMSRPEFRRWMSLK